VVIRQLTALAWFELPSGMPLSDKTRYDEQLTVVLIFILFGYLTWTDAWRNWFKLIFLIAPTGIVLLRYMWSYFLALSRNLYVVHTIFSRKICFYHPLLFHLACLFQIVKWMFLCLVRQTCLFMLLLPHIMLPVQLQSQTQNDFFTASYSGFRIPLMYNKLVNTQHDYLHYTPYVIVYRRSGCISWFKLCKFWPTIRQYM